MSFRALILSLFAAIVMAGTVAQAAEWPALPAACLPGRAAPWDGNTGAGFQAACHCPPASLCPQTFEEYSNVSLHRMPTNLIYGTEGAARCCPVIQPEACPAGSYYAGQPVSVVPNQNCNPPLCPAGSQLANMPVPSDNECNPARCPAGSNEEGQPTPPGGCTWPALCAPKFYPNFDETATSGQADGYTYADGRRMTFDLEDDFGAYSTPQNPVFPSMTRSISQRYGFSIRVDSMKEWVFGPRHCTFWGYECYADTGYKPLSGGANTGHETLQELLNRIGRDRATWFGFSVLPIAALQNNLLDPPALAAMNGQDRMTLVDKFAMAANEMTGGPILIRTPVAVPAAMQASVGPMIDQCRQVGGEYVELQYVNQGALQCPYLQCRYVFSSSSTESCLSGDTKIALADGSSKAVKDLALGDLVKGSGGAHKITAANTYQSGLRVLWGINGSGAMLTGDHPVHTTDGWKVIGSDAAKLYAGKPGFAATALTVGDSLVTDKGNVKVTSITRFPQVEPIATYNIKVDGNEGFFANGIEVKGFDKMEMHYE